MIKTTILHGKVVADSIKEKLSHEIADLLNQNIPLIEYAVDEAIQSGIEKFIFVVSPK